MSILALKPPERGDTSDWVYKVGGGADWHVTDPYSDIEERHGLV